MKILVVAHRLELGGTQVNAIELATVLQRRHGHEVVVAAAPGPAEAMLARNGLRYLPLPDADRHPTRGRVRVLADIGVQEAPDLVHVWDWPQCFDAYPGLHVRQRRPMLCSVMSMSVARNLPRHLPITYGTPLLRRSASHRRRGPVYLLEPPVDLSANRPDKALADAWRRAMRIADDELLIVAVTRIEHHMKLEGLQRTLDCMPSLARSHPVRLAVVGEGSALSRVQARADEVNREAGRHVVTLTGGLLDPRPAYAAADVVVGMGSSALRAMAHSKPVVVLGEQGFSRLLDERSFGRFADGGYYGRGDGTDDDLCGQLRQLLSDPSERLRVGRFSAEAVQRYSLDDAGARLAMYCEDAVDLPTNPAVARLEGARSAGLVVAGRGRTLASAVRLSRTVPAQRAAPRTSVRSGEAS